MSYRLILTSTEPEKIFYLHLGENNIGRDAAVNHIQLIGNDISRCHAMINLTEEQCVIQDMQSTNGIAINNKSTSKANLQNGDIISIGDMVLRIETTEEPYGGNADFAPNKFSDKTRFATMKHKAVHPSRLKSFFKRNKE